MTSSMENRRHELLSDVALNMKLLAIEHGVSEEIAEQLGINAANFLAEHWGGQMLSIPKDHFFKLAERDELIYADFKGNNWSELIRKYNMTENGIRRVINRVHKRIINKLQPDLFYGSTDET